MKIIAITIWLILLNSCFTDSPDYSKVHVLQGKGTLDNSVVLFGAKEFIGIDTLTREINYHVKFDTFIGALKLADKVFVADDGHDVGYSGQRIFVLNNKAEKIHTIKSSIGPTYLHEHFGKVFAMGTLVQSVPLPVKIYDPTTFKELKDFHPGFNIRPMESVVHGEGKLFLKDAISDTISGSEYTDSIKFMEMDSNFNTSEFTIKAPDSSIAPMICKLKNKYAIFSLHQNPKIYVYEDFKNKPINSVNYTNLHPALKNIVPQPKQIITRENELVFHVWDKEAYIFGLTLEPLQINWLYKHTETFTGSVEIAGDRIYGVDRKGAVIYNIKTNSVEKTIPFKHNF